MIPSDLPSFFQQHPVRDVECLFADLNGYPRGKLMPAKSFAQHNELRISQAIVMQAITGEYSYHPIFPDADPDVRMEPDYRTLNLAPWSRNARAFAICDCVQMDGKLCPFTPRSVLQMVLSRYQATGLTPVVAPEIEFYLLAPNPDPREPFSPPALRNGNSERGQSAFSLNMLNEQAPFWDEFHAALDQLGIGGDTWLHEMGNSQFEINLLHGDPLQLADRAFLFKYLAKELAQKHGMSAVFMAKPLAGQAGSSMHLHQSVVDATGNNIFANPNGSDSAQLLHYIGGLQRYLPDLMLIFAPSVNSFRRFIPNSQAPINLHWGLDNRSAGLRVPVSTASARRVENRLAGADANPYLLIAASLAAGLAGLEQKIPAREPLTGSGYNHAYDLAPTFLAAHEAMRQSEMARQLLGADFVTGYCEVKMLEYQSYLNEISAWERRYLAAQA